LDKPYNTVKRIREDKAARNRVAEVLKYLLFDTEKPPFETVVAWNDTAVLDAAIANFDKMEAGSMRKATPARPATPARRANRAGRASRAGYKDALASLIE